VIAVRAGGAAELFDDGHEALGCPMGDPAALAAAIDRLIGDAGLRHRLGEAGRSAACDRFDRRALASRWVPIYEHCGGGPRAGAARVPEARDEKVAQPS
jgi:glycosyltransferase involved in cell wall biosynthesis